MRGSQRASGAQPHSWIQYFSSHYWRENRPFRASLNSGQTLDEFIRSVYADVSAENQKPWEEFQNKALGLSSFITHSPETKHTLTVCCYVGFMAHCFALCLCWSITASVRSRVSRGRAGRPLGRCTCIPPYRHHPCSSRPSYKSPLMTRRRRGGGGRRDSRQGGRGRLKSAAMQEESLEWFHLRIRWFPGSDVFLISLI